MVTKKKQAENERVHDLVKEQAELEPKPVQRAEQFRIDKRDEQERRRNRQHPFPGRAVFRPVVPQVERAQESEEARKDETETTIGARLYVLFSRKVLM